jgi:hypothetical protein
MSENTKKNQKNKTQDELKELVLGNVEKRNYKSEKFLELETLVK